MKWYNNILMLVLLVVALFTVAWTPVRDARYYTNENRFEKPVKMQDTFQVNTVSELTSGSGVVVDGVTLKDGGVTATGDVDLSTAGASIDLNGGIISVTNAAGGDGVRIRTDSGVNAVALSAAGPGAVNGGQIAIKYSTGTNSVLIQSGLSSGATVTMSDTNDNDVIVAGVNSGIKIDGKPLVVTNIANGAQAVIVDMDSAEVSIVRIGPSAASIYVGDPDATHIEVSNGQIDMNTNDIREVQYVNFYPAVSAPSIAGNGDLFYLSNGSSVTGLYCNITGVLHKITTSVAP